MVYLTLSSIDHSVIHHSVPSGNAVGIRCGAFSGHRSYRFRLQGQSADRWVLWRASTNHPFLCMLICPEASSVSADVALGRRWAGQGTSLIARQVAAKAAWRLLVNATPRIIRKRAAACRHQPEAPCRCGGGPPVRLSGLGR
jgi:hypothetical protein